MSVTTEKKIIKILKTMKKPEYCATLNTSYTCHKLTIHLTLVCERLTRNKNNSDNNNTKQWTAGAWEVVQKQWHFPRGFIKLLTVVETSKNWEIKVITPKILLTTVCFFYFFKA